MDTWVVRSIKWSKIFQEEVKKNRGLFDVEILAYYETREEVLQAEYDIQIELDVMNSMEYFNESVAAPNGFHGHDTSGKNNPIHGRKNEVVALNLLTNKK